MQLVPTVVHYNLVQTIADNNDVFALGVGGRIKLSQRIAITGEYTYQVNPNSYLVDGNPVNYKNSASVGIDIETGGHVFQLHLTNSRGMADPQWIGMTPGTWGNGDVYLGFNISRVFTLRKPKTPDEPQW